MLSSIPPRALDARSARKGPTTPGYVYLRPKWWFEGRYVRVGAIPGSIIVVLERTPESSGDSDVSVVFGPAEDALRRIQRGDFSLLVDVRRAPGRNDAEFEKKFVPYRQRMHAGFRRVAVLVATPHGRLQVQRYAREDGTSSAAFDDYQEAATWLEQIPDRKR
jgi:hypothetical protein